MDYYLSKKTMKEKLDLDFRRYTILGACNPGYAHAAIELDDKIGTLLPCNFMIQETDAGTEIAAMNPEVTMSSLPGPEIEDIGRAIARKVRNVLDKF